MIARDTRQSSAPIKWHGGKTYLAKRIIDLMPEHVHYVEPYFGGGAVLFKKPAVWIENHSEVVNDVFGELMNFWNVLRSTKYFHDFERQVSLTPFGKTAWEESVCVKPQDVVERAVAFFVRYRQSRQGLGRDFATMSRNRTRRGMNEQVSSWLSAIDGLHEAHLRLRKVVIYSEDAVDVICREDDSKTFFYCDPPYVCSTRIVKDAYQFEMSDDQHKRLLDTLGQVKGKFLLSGYRNTLYDAAAKRFHWKRTDVVIDNKASSQKTKPTKLECLWNNYR